MLTFDQLAAAIEDQQADRPLQHQKALEARSRLLAHMAVRPT